jgi:hypothetical protein
MTAVSVGKEILSQCNKCKLILAHIIVTMKANNPEKVMCKTCKGTHAYKDPSAKKTKPSVDRIVKKAKSGGRKITETVAEMWDKAMNKATNSPLEYSMKASFQIGDVITHPTFGNGIVEKLIDNNKIEILFQDDYRTLMHKK